MKFHINSEIRQVHIDDATDPFSLFRRLLSLAAHIERLLAQGFRVFIFEAPVSRHSEVVAAAVLHGRRGRTQREAVTLLSLRGCARGSDTRQRLAAALAWRELRRSRLFQRLPDCTQLRILELL